MVRIRWALALALVAIAVPALAGDSVGADVMRAVDQFVVTLQGDSFSAFDPIRDGGDVAQWRDAQTTMQRYRCITVSRATVRKTRREGARLVVELDVIGSGTMRGASARAAAIPLQWLLTLDTSAAAPRFISAETKETVVVRELLSALPRPPDTAAVLARGVDLMEVIRKLVYEAADPSYAKTGDVAMDWATGVAIELGDRSAEAYCRALHATLHVMRQDCERARALATDALQIAVEVNDADTQVSALFPLAFSTSALDHPDGGLRLFHRAANLLPLADDPRPALRALHMASYYESVRGNFAGALSAAGRLAREAAIADWPEGVTMARFTLSVVHVELGEEAAAQDLLRRIAADTDQQGDVALATVARIDLAGSLIREGRTEEAEAILRVAVPQIGRLTAWDQPGAYLQLSHMARRRGNFEEAREFLRLLRDRHKAAGTLVPTEVLQAESQVAYASRDAAGALQAATRALEAYRTDAGPALPYASAWPLELLVARILRDAGKCGEAAEHLRQAIAIVEADLQEVVAGEAGHVSYFEARLDPYRELIDLLVEEQQVEEAFTVSEAMRARRLRDLTARAALRPSVERSASEAAEGAALEADLAQLNRALLAASASEAGAVREELAAARAELAAFELRMSVAHPETARRPLVLADIPPPPAGTAVIEYVVLPERTIAFVSRRDQHGRPLLVARQLPVSRKRLAAATDAFVRAIERLDFAVDDAGQAVRALVFDPLAADLQDVTNLRVVPSDVLWNVPFDALRNADRSYLVDRFSISYTPALSFQPDAAPRTPPRTLLAVANPDAGVAARPGANGLVPLDDAQEEANAIGALYGRRGRVLTGAAATELAFKSDARAYSVLHVATHGLLDDRAPLFSAVVLAPAGNDDGLLEAREILGAGLRAELLVLSACETGRGRIRQGEGMVGMTWAALAGGVSTVVVSQWKAESRSTRALMIDFHRELLAGREKAEALALAKRRLKRRPEFAHPFFWASFVAVGAAR